MAQRKQQTEQVEVVVERDEISPKVLVPALTSIALAVVIAVVSGDWTVVGAILTAGAAQAGVGYQTPDPVDVPKA